MRGVVVQASFHVRQQRGCAAAEDRREQAVEAFDDQKGGTPDCGEGWGPMSGSRIASICLA